MNKLNFKRILILEPHIDDMELGCSVLLEFLKPGAEIDIITFCYGTNKDNHRERQLKRDQNIKVWEDQELMVTNKLIHKDKSKIKDTKLKMHDINLYCKQVSKLTTYGLSDYDLILIPQKDLHNDHRIVNEVGLILTRSFGKTIWEYLIMNSFPEDCNEYYNPKYNIQFSVPFGMDGGFNNQVDRVLGVCEFPTENSCKSKALKRQKNRGENYLRDRFNIIRYDIIGNETNNVLYNSIGSEIEEKVDTEEKAINHDCVDTIGIKINEGDLILLYNGNQETKKWSWEKVGSHNGELCSAFEKLMGSIYTKIKDIPPNWLVVVRTKDDDMFLHCNAAVLPK